MRRTGDYVEKLANNIEQKLNMTSKELSEMSRTEFKNLLKNAYFSQKKYIRAGYREPTDKQLDVLDLHYGRPIKIKRTEQPMYANKEFYYTHKTTNKKIFITYVRKNKRGRLIDARTGKFVAKKKQNKK